MNVEIGTYAAHFPEKEYIKGIFLAVLHICPLYDCMCRLPIFNLFLILLQTT